MATVSEKSMSACEQHETEEVRFYCEDCKVMICDDCIVGGHRQHKTIKLKEFGVKCRESFTKATATAEVTKIPKLQKYINQAKDKQNNYSSSINKEIERIKSKRGLLNTILDELQQELIDTLQKEDGESKQQYDRFINNQELKEKKIKEIVQHIKLKGTDISDTEVAKYNITLKELLVHDPYSDIVPNLVPPHYLFHEEFVSKEKLQHFIGYIESDTYATVGSEHIPEIALKENGENIGDNDAKTDTPPTQLYTDLMSNRKLTFQTIVSFNIDNSISFIVPKEEEGLNAWIIEKHVTEVECSGTKVNPKLIIKHMDQQIVSACTNKDKELLVGFPNKPNLKQLHLTTNKLTRNKTYRLVSSFNITLGKNNLACVCRSRVCVEEHILCLQDESIPENYILRWYSNGKPTDKELSLSSSKIDVNRPVQICQNVDGHICIVCRPENTTSWVVVIDKDGNKILCFPDHEIKGKANGVYFVGAGFLEDNTITISDSANCEQIRITQDGQCIQRDKYDIQPVCCSVDCSYNVWIGFKDGTVKVINYKQEHEYSEFKIGTSL